MKQTTEIPQVFNHERFNAVSAREVYPGYADTLDTYRQAIDEGSISLLRVGPGDACDAMVGVRREQFEDLGLTVQTGDFDEVAASVPLRNSDEFNRRVHDKVVSTSLNVLSQNRRTSGLWWVPINENSRDHYEWLDGQLLHDVADVEVGDLAMTLSNFSDKVDIDAVYEGLPEALGMFVDRGINLAEYIKAINIFPADSPIFEVPDTIKALKPDAYIAAFVSGSGVFVFNERTFEKAEPIDKPLENGLTTGGGWRGTFVHEVAHVFDLGLDGDDPAIAESMGWRKDMDNVSQYAYGATAEIVSENEFGITIRDDYGYEISMLRSHLPDSLVNTNGSPSKPPTKYAAENSKEDIAETVAAYMGVGGLRHVLDERRVRAAEVILAKQRNISEGDTPDIKVIPRDPHFYNVFTHLPQPVKYRLSSVW